MLGLSGKYTYAVGSTDGYAPSPAAGTIVVAGTSATVSITFRPATFAVTLTETGLPAGTPWSAVLNGVNESSVTSSITFAVANGTYAYTVNGVANFRAAPGSGNLTVRGGPQRIPVVYAHTLYSIVFDEVGLPGGTSWIVSLNGVNASSPSSLITFAAANGTFRYLIGSIDGYAPADPSGTVTVHGSSLTVSVVFSSSVLPRPSPRAEPASRASVSARAADLGAGSGTPLSAIRAPFGRDAPRSA